MLTGDISWSLIKKRHKYIEEYQLNDAHRRSEHSKSIVVPITYTSKVKRSRIKNVVVFYRHFRDIDSFNTNFNLNKKLEDIPAKR